MLSEGLKCERPVAHRLKVDGRHHKQTYNVQGVTVTYKLKGKGQVS